MERVILILTCLLLISLRLPIADSSVLSAVLSPKDSETLQRQERSYYERYGSRRPLYDRADYDRPSSCGRCDDRYDDRYDDRDDYDGGRDRYDDDRRSNRPSSGSRYDKNKDYDDDRRYSSDKKNGPKNGTEEDNDPDKKRPYDDRDRPSSGRKGSKGRHKYDDRDRYRPDYYDRFLRDPYRYDRPYYDDPYRERRPYERYPYSDRYDDDYRGRYDGYGYPGYRRPYYDDRYDRGSAYDVYGGYGPGVGRGAHESFRPWDETYRGQSGWDDGGRGYYFASGRPDTAPSQYWGRPEYSRSPNTNSWSNVGYSTGYRDPVADYRGSFGYGQTGGYGQTSGYGQTGGYGQIGGYRQENSQYGQSSGWHSVGERRPYRDQSGVIQLDDNNSKGRYGQGGERQAVYGQPNNNQANPNIYGSSSTTPGTSYLHARDDNIVTAKPAEDSSTPAS